MLIYHPKRFYRVLHYFFPNAKLAIWRYIKHCSHLTRKIDASILKIGLRNKFCQSLFNCDDLAGFNYVSLSKGIITDFFDWFWLNTVINSNIEQDCFVFSKFWTSYNVNWQQFSSPIIPSCIVTLNLIHLLNIFHILGETGNADEQDGIMINVQSQKVGIVICWKILSHSLNKYCQLEHRVHTHYAWNLQN